MLFELGKTQRLEHRFKTAKPGLAALTKAVISARSSSSKSAQRDFQIGFVTSLALGLGGFGNAAAALGLGQAALGLGQAFGVVGRDVAGREAHSCCRIDCTKYPAAFFAIILFDVFTSQSNTSIFARMRSIENAVASLAAVFGRTPRATSASVHSERSAVVASSSASGPSDRESK